MKIELSPLEEAWKEVIKHCDCQYCNEALYIVGTALKRLIELEKSLRKNATREKAKMLDKYIKKFFIPEKRWRDVHYIFDSNEKWACMYRDLLKDSPQSNGTKYPTCEEDKED